MSVILYTKEEFGSLAYHLTHTNQDLRDLALPYHEKLKLQRFKLRPGDEDRNIICWVDRLYVANQLAFHQTYSWGEGRFEITPLDEEDINPNSIHWDYRKLYDFLNSLHYNLFSNGGRSFISTEDMARLDGLIGGVARRIIDGPTHYGGF
jgi:hypothetical protein